MIQRIIKQHQECIEALISNELILSYVQKAADMMTSCLRHDGKILLCGNGGSASDAQHIAAELSGRFLKNRKALFAEALTANTSYLTAVANDYSYEHIYARALEAKGRKGDVLIAISTSGNSANIVQACEYAREHGITIIGLTGSKTGKMDALCDVIIKIPSDHTPRIQEAHILIGHILCEYVESQLFPEG